MKQLFRRHFLWFSEKIEKDAVASYAAETSFWIMIALIPFVMFLLTLLQTVRIENTSLLFTFTALLPAPISTLLHTLFSEIQPPSGLLSATAVLCVWSASNGTLALIKGLFSVFEASGKHSFIRMRILALLYTLALAAILTVGLGVFLLADSLRDKLQLQSLSAFAPYIGAALLLLFFWLLFWAITGKRVNARCAFWVAALSAAGWGIFSLFFSVFVESFANYSTLYGSLAAIVIWMMWLYFCMYIFLFGGETAMWLQFSSAKDDFRKLFYARRRRTSAQKGHTDGKKTSGR